MSNIPTFTLLLRLQCSVPQLKYFMNYNKLLKRFDKKNVNFSRSILY